jgi:hypothetical protein
MATRRDLEIISHFRTQPLNAGGPTVLGRDFPLGEGWYQMMLRFNIVVVIGTGAGPVTEGELLVIKNVILRTSAGEVVCQLPGRALYKIATVKGGTVPRKDAIAAASATYSVDIPLWFADDSMQIPEDTMLDTSRYNSIQLEIQMGSVADLFTAPGTATATFNLDTEIERTKGLLPKEAQPIFHIQYAAAPPIDAFSQTFIDLERSPDMAYKRLFAHASSSGTPGGIFTGANADDVQALESIVDQSGDIIRERFHEMIQNQNKRVYSLETVLAGITVFDFVRDGSINSALYPGDRSRLQYKWTNKAGVAANDIVSVAQEAIRGLKG